MKYLDVIIRSIISGIIVAIVLAIINIDNLKTMLPGLTTEQFLCIIFCFAAFVVGLAVWDITQHRLEKKYAELQQRIENTEKIEKEYEDKLKKALEQAATYKAELDRRDQEDEESKDRRAYQRYRKSNELQ